MIRRFEGMQVCFVILAVIGAAALVSCSQGGSRNQHSGFSNPQNVLSNSHGTTTEGGADPSGGEGQRSSTAKLSRSVESGLAELPNIFLRVKYFLKSKDASDAAIAHELWFLKDCFEKNSPSCKGEIFGTIAKITEAFRSSPQFVKRDCPSKEAYHEITDMSITQDLKLCVSEQLTRYPERELQRQVRSLLAHELAHGLGFCEDLAKTVQYWVLEHERVVSPSDSLVNQLNKRNGKVSLRMSLLARLFGQKDTPKEPMRVCEYVGQLNFDFQDVESLYLGAEGETLVTLPQDPILKASQAVHNQADALVVDYCIKRLPTSDLQLMLGALVSLSDKLELLQSHLSRYIKKASQKDVLNAMPDIKSRLILAVALDDTLAESNVTGPTRCTVEGTTNSIQYKLGVGSRAAQSIEYAELLPGKAAASLPKMKLEFSKLNPDGGTGVALSFEQTEQFRARIVDGVNASTSISLLGREHSFITKFQLETSDGVKYGPEIAITCTDKP